MNRNLKKIWGELTNYLSKEQSFFIFLYTGFVAYLKNTEQGTWALQKENSESEEFKQLREIFKGIPGDELKRAANDFEESIAWEMLSAGKPCYKIVSELSRIFHYSVKSCEDLERIITEAQGFVATLDGLIFTPESVNQLIAALPVNEDTHSIGELYCGLSGTGIAVFQSLSGRFSEVHLRGEEQRKLYCDISLIRMFCHGIEGPEVIWRDIREEEGGDTYDLVIGDLPKGNNESVYVGRQEIFLGDKDRVFTEWIAIQRLLNRVNEKGKAVIVVTKGALVRQREQSIREILTEKDWLEAVITLPANLYASTHLGFELLVLNKKKPKSYSRRVFLADISGEKPDRGGFNEISKEVIDRLKNAYENLEECPLFSTVVSLEEIAEKDFSWNPFLYLRRKDFDKKKQSTIELGKIAGIVRGVQITKQEEQMLAEQATHYWLNIRNLGDEGISFDKNSMLRARNMDWEEKFGIQEDDIILTSKGALLKVCMVERDMPKAFLCGNLTRIRVDQEKYSPYVLYEFLKSREGQAVLESIQSGTTIKVLSNSNLEKMPVPIYPDVQEKGAQLKAIYQEYRTEEREIRSRFEKKRKQLWETM